MLKIGYTDSLQAELCGVRKGLHLARRLGVPKLIMELDVMLAVCFLNHPFDNIHPLSTLVRDCLAVIIEG
ncbi:hypothetical protein PVK06_016399 [Gossypium arboreum]|uniref:RNase H type-1 domain-containing protein n=1 Tax=Gossypium arboreum TaxID=29729 RepID=A0ABR0Q0N9_GOSAR|nr:hypothetical protein PVK06_016399 [Gossypium arboreum]